MSYQYKKSSILYQLEQAIKKKVAEKPKSREQACQRGLQPSLQKRKTQNLRQSVQRLPSKNKQSIKLTKAENMTLFNNENLSNLHSNVMESKLAEHKKFNNRKMDKLFSLVNYAISSADKAMKYINYANFQGQFAVKLFKSDKQNLLNEMKNLTCEDLLDQSSNRQQNSSSKISHVPNVIILQEENMKLKKQLAILEKQNERSRFGGQPVDLNLTLLLRQLQIQKYKQSIYRIKGKQFIEKLENIIQKQLKYESIATKGHHSPSKQFDSIVKSLISERNNLCKDSEYLSVDRRQWDDIKYFIDTKMAVLANKKDGSYLKILQMYVATVELQLTQKSTKKPHSQEHIQAQQQKISKIKEEKQELMRQIQLCKKKLGEMIEITKLKSEIQVHKKQLNKIHSKLLKSNIVEEESEQLTTDELITCVISKLKSKEANKQQSGLAERVQQYQAQLQEYRNENQMLQKQLEEKISQINSVGIDKIKLAEKLNGKVKQCEKLQKQMDNIKKEKVQKQNALRQAQKQNAYLIAKLQQLQNQRKQQQQRQQEQQQQQMQEQISKLNQKIKQQSQLLQQYEQHQQKLTQQLSHQRAQLQSRKQQQMKKQQHYKQQIQVLQSNIAKLSQQNQQIKQDSQSTINSLERDIQAISDKFELVKQNYELTINNLKKEMMANNEEHLKKVQEMQAEHDRQVEQLQQSISEQKAKAQSCKQNNIQQQNRIKQKLEQIEGELASQQLKSKQLQHEVCQQKCKADKLSAEIEEKDKTITTLQNNVSQKSTYETGMRQQIEGYRKRIIDMNTKMQHLEQENKHHIQQQSALKQRQAELKQRQRALELTCSECRIQSTDLKLQLEQKINELTQIYSEINESSAQSNRLSALQQELSAKQQQLSSRQQQLSSRQLQLQQKIQHMKIKQQNVDRKCKQIEQKQMQLNAKQKQMQAISLQHQQASTVNENSQIAAIQKVQEQMKMEERENRIKQKQEQIEQKEIRLVNQMKQICINRNRVDSQQQELGKRIKQLEWKEQQYANKVNQLEEKQKQINAQRATLQSRANQLKEKQSLNSNIRQQQEHQKQLIRTMLQQKQNEIIEQYESKLAYVKQQTEQQLANMKQLLQQTIHAQQGRIQQQRKEIEQHQKHIADKQAELRQKQMRIAEYQMSEEQINTKVELLSSQLASMQQLKDKQMEQEAKQYKAKQNILLERIQVLDKELNIKSHALHELSELQGSLESEVQQKSVLIERLEMRISIKQKQIESANSRGQLLEKQNHTLLEQLQKIGEEISQIKQRQVEDAGVEEEQEKKKEEEEKKEKKEELLNLLKNIEQMQERIQQFEIRQKELNQLHENYKSSIKQLKEQLQQKNSMLADKQTQYQDLVLKYQINIINADQFQQDRTKRNEQIALLNMKIEELSKHNKNLQHWKNVQLMYEKQYFNLSKRILSVIFDLSQLGNVDEMGLRSLLEIGSQKAIQHKKRLRDQQSNQKRRREASENELQEQQKQNYYLKKDGEKNINPSVDLFSTHSQLPGMGSELGNDSIKLQKKQEQGKDGEHNIQNLQQFDNFQSGMNSSMISEDGLIQKSFHDQQHSKQTELKQIVQSKDATYKIQKRQNQNKENNQRQQLDKGLQNIEDFNDYQSERMNQSMLSNNQEQKFNPFSQNKEQQNELSSDLDHQSSPPANKTQDINIPVSVDSNQNKKANKEADSSNTAFQFDEFKDNNYSELDSSLISEKNCEQPLQLQVQVEKPALKTISQRANQQIKVQQKVALIQDKELEHENLDKFNIGMDISQIARTQPNNQGNNSMEFQNFLDFQNNNLDSSMVSQKLEKDDKQLNKEFNLQNTKVLDKEEQKQIHASSENKNGQNDFGDFNDYESNKLSESMISQTEIKIEKIQFENKAVFHPNQQKEPSLQKQQNDLDDFADFKSEKLDSSMISDTDINFAQNQKQLAPSKTEPKETSNQANFDEFGEFNSSMNSSMMSDYENSSNK